MSTPLSFIAEYEYCPRSAFWLLTNAPRVRDENDFIQSGRAAHQVVDEKYFRSKNTKKIESSVRIFSEKFGISGVIDVVEFSQKGNKLEIIPVEFKRGKIRKNTMHETQLALAAICLREIFPDSKIERAAIFFTEDRQKREILLTPEKIKTAEHLAKMIQEKELLPKNFPMQKDAKCKGCCFRALCF